MERILILHLQINNFAMDMIRKRMGNETEK